jgi:hypothetical protein
MKKDLGCGPSLVDVSQVWSLVIGLAWPEMTWPNRYMRVRYKQATITLGSCIPLITPALNIGHNNFFF